MNAFGEKLQELRKKRNLSQKEVASRLGLHTKTISNYENDSVTPSVEVLIQLAILYNSSVDYILGLSKRTHLYLDDCTPEQQKIILNVVDVLKADLNNYKAK